HARLRIVAEVTAEAEGARAVRRRIELAERITERDRVDPVEGEAARVRGSAVDVAQRRSGHGVPRAVPVTDLAEAAGGRDRLAPVDAYRNPHAAVGLEPAGRRVEEDERALDLGHLTAGARRRDLGRHRRASRPAAHVETDVAQEIGQRSPLHRGRAAAEYVHVTPGRAHRVAGARLGVGLDRELALIEVGHAKRAVGVAREKYQDSLAHGELRATLDPRLHAGHATAELPDRQRPEWDLALQAVANVQRDDGEDPARRGMPAALDGPH